MRVPRVLEAEGVATTRPKPKAEREPYGLALDPTRLKTLYQAEPWIVQYLDWSGSRTISSRTPPWPAAGGSSCTRGCGARIKKQSDFALFGRTLDISMVPVPNESLFAQCARFPMYQVGGRDVLAAISVCGKVVGDNRRRHVKGEPAYRLLTPGFFEAARQEAHETMVGGLKAIVGE